MSYQCKRIPVCEENGELTAGGPKEHDSRPGWRPQRTRLTARLAAPKKSPLAFNQGGEINSLKSMAKFSEVPVTFSVVPCPRGRTISSISTMASGAVDKLNYLKRYMSDGKDAGDQRKKKKKSKLGGKGITVIDADSAVSSRKHGKPTDHDDDELAPTIAEIHDETIPKGMSDSTKWKSIAPKPSSGERSVNKSSVKIKQESPDSDISPPRHNHSGRKRESPDSDISPPRRNRSEGSRQQNSKADDSDLSPDRDTSAKRSSLRKIRTQRDSPDSDLSPVRSTRPGESSSRAADEIAISKSRHAPKPDTRSGNRRQRRDDSEDLSPPRGEPDGHGSRSLRPEEPKGLPTKTLSGMTAGIQNARILREEMDQRRVREEEMFRKMDAEISGRGAETIYRDRKTGKKRNVEAERAAEAEKAERERVHKERFDKWGKGLAQAKKREEGREDALHEMDKPLARYVDDADRDALLKAQDRIGDPMLEFLSKKKGCSSGAAKVERPKYKGPPPPPNRFGILPGYRWDGLDRSNGFEKTRFNRISNKTATTEQAYKWSTEDM